jgi:hypothetical protein
MKNISTKYTHNSLHLMKQKFSVKLEGKIWSRNASKCSVQRVFPALYAFQSISDLQRFICELFCIVIKSEGSDS